MNTLLLLAAVILIACIIGNKLSKRLGIPMLFFFIALGMIFGSDGLLKIEFEDYALAEKICSAALIFIMFYGGFGTKWSTARPVAAKSILLSTLGVLITAGLTGLFCHYALGRSMLEGMLIGAVLGSTDAASVFSILRSRRLNLKYGTAPMLEIESGSNDPCAYMMTVMILSAMGGTPSAGDMLYAVFAQVAYGAAAGVAAAFLARWLLKRFHLDSDGLGSIFLLAVALLSYTVPSLLGGNGYLSAYIAGIILGNSRIPQKKALVNFFDAFNSMMQILIFFLLGLLVFPSRLPEYLLPSLFIALFLTFIARPAAVAILLTPFRAPLRQQVVVSWAGLRGAASIVFAIVAATSPNYADETIFQIVFCVVLLSLLFQGTLLPWISKKVHMIDNNENVMKTFNDYSEETSVQFIRLEIEPGHPWIDRPIMEINPLPGTLIAAVLRDGEALIPKGSTVLREGDSLIIGAKEYLDHDGIELSEIKIDADSPLVGKKLHEVDLEDHSLVILIQRGRADIIPDGDSTILEGDTLVLYTKT